MSSIERRIKEKIETIGIPLKSWDIQINYGIKTGFNDAFIIDGKTKDELIAKSAKNAEIIRPILRGRDIKRYGYEFADLWLICTHNGTPTIPPINIEDYPDIKAHLDKYYIQLSERQDKGCTPYNLRSCIYMDDFSKQKIVWLTITDSPKFAIDISGAICLNSIFFITGNEHLTTILATLNSKLIEWYFDGICVSTGVGTNKWEKFIVEKIPIPKVSDLKDTEIKKVIDSYINYQGDAFKQSLLNNSINQLIYELYNLDNDEIKYIENL